jgi:arylsulfatase A-like enzyme
MKKTCQFRSVFYSAILIGMLFFYFACTSSNTGDAENRRPNIILIFTDDQGYGDVAIHDNQDIHTPALDALARQSVRLDNFRSQAVCSPSRATLMTGRHFLKTGVWGTNGGRQYLNLDETTIADILQDAGYHTAMLGKWHLGKVGPYKPQERGFKDTWRLLDNHDHVDPILDHNGTTLQVQGWTVDYLTDRVIDLLEQKQNQPQFIYLAYPLIHEPYEAPDSLVQRYLAKGFSASLSTLYAMTEQLDYNVGRLMQALDETGLKENTIVLFIGDNGRIGNPVNMPHLTEGELDRRNPQGFRGLKGHLFDGGLRVPAFVSWPKRFPPRVVDANTDLTDILPTLLEVSGTSLPDENKPLDGISLAPILRGEVDTMAARYLYYANHEAGWPGRTEQFLLLGDRRRLEFDLTDLAVLYGDYKYLDIWGIYDIPLKELYNVDNEPSEKTSLNDSLPELRAQLEEQLKNWWHGTILQNSNSYNLPTFVIGYPGEDIHYAYAEAPSALYGNVERRWNYTMNWRTDGDGQDIPIQIVQSGRYKISADIEVAHAIGSLEIVIDKQRLIAPINDGNVLQLGELDLEEGLADLQIRLIGVPTNDQLVLDKFTAIKFQWQP